MMRPDPDLPKIYLCLEPVDFRKAIQGLSLLVEQELELNPFDATLFVFINRRRDNIKILHWKKNGFGLWYKRLKNNVLNGRSIMPISTKPLPNDPDKLKELLVNERMASALREDNLKQQNHSLLEALRLEKHREYGKSSEKASNQSELFD